MFYPFYAKEKKDGLPGDFLSHRPADLKAKIIEKNANKKPLQNRGYNLQTNCYVKNVYLFLNIYCKIEFVFTDNCYMNL